MADVDQSTVDSAFTPSSDLTGEIARVKTERAALGAQEKPLLEQQQESLKQQETTLRERGAAAQPLREDIVAADARRPSARVQTEEIPDFQLPKKDPKQMQETMSVLMIGAALLGAASRTPFFGTMAAMQGAMDGYNEGNQQKIKQATLEYDKNVAAIKARNDEKRKDVAAAIEDNKNDVAAMKRKLELTLLKYDDQINLQALRTQPINDALKRIQDREKQDDVLIAHLLQTQATLQSWQYRPGRGATGRGVTPSSTDTKNALAIIANDERFAEMAPGDKTAFATAAASIAKSLTISKEAADFDEGMDMAIEELVKGGRVKPGADKTWGWVPFTGSAPKFGPAGEETGAAASPDKDGLAQQAKDAIAKGKDPEAVKRRYKEMTGEELGGV
jgi:hypothetical protein